MQNKGIVLVTAVLLTLASIFYLSFSVATSYYDSQAAKIKDPIAQQDMDGIHAQRLQVIDGPGFGECHEFPRIPRIRTGNGKIAMVHLIDHKVGRRFHHRSTVVLPPCRVGCCHIDDGPAFAIHSDCLGEDARTLATAHVEGIELSHEVTLH